MKTRYIDLPSYVTKDGSVIREMMHPEHHGNKNQSIAEATIPVNGKTLLHKHKGTEEIYVILQGVGLMRLGDEEFEVTEGDTIAIVPGTPHNIRNISDSELKILCSCSPAYRHDDTFIINDKSLNDEESS